MKRGNISSLFFAKEAITMTERRYQRKIIRRLEGLFPGCVILITGADHIQGIPDLVILWHRFWAALEVKLSPMSPKQPNQDYYIEQLDLMSFAAYIYPENEEEVLDALQQAFESPRRARVPQS
jgi:hypothetical protein